MHCQQNAGGAYEDLGNLVKRQQMMIELFYDPLFRFAFFAWERNNGAFSQLANGRIVLFRDEHPDGKWELSQINQD